MQFAEKDDGATIQSLKDEIEKKNKEMDMMKRKDFDTLRKQNESISHIQREFDDFANNANEKIQILTSELQRYKQEEELRAPGATHGVAQVELAGELEKDGIDDRDSFSSSRDNTSESGMKSTREFLESKKGVDDSDNYNSNDEGINNEVDEEKFKFTAISSKENNSEFVSIHPKFRAS